MAVWHNPATVGMDFTKPPQLPKEKGETNMYINEAAKLAHKLGTCFYRTDGDAGHISFIPTNTDECCIVSSSRNPTKLIRGWEPKLDDLTTDQWQVGGQLRYELSEKVAALEVPVQEQQTPVGPKIFTLQLNKSGVMELRGTLIRSMSHVPKDKKNDPQYEPTWKLIKTLEDWVWNYRKD